jgi:hypothetical protein
VGRADEVIIRTMQDECLCANRCWSAFWRIDPRPHGRPAPDGRVVETLDGKFDRIASGDLVVIVAAGLRASSLRPASRRFRSAASRRVRSSSRPVAVMTTRSCQHFMAPATARLRCRRHHYTNPQPRSASLRRECVIEPVTRVRLVEGDCSEPLRLKRGEWSFLRP